MASSSSSATSHGGLGGGGGGTGFGRASHMRKSHKATPPKTSPTESHESARLSEVHSSRCTKPGGFGLGIASGVFAVGSSTTMTCSFVHVVAISPFARATATGSGGSAMVLRPGVGGSSTIGSSKCVVSSVFCGSSGSVQRRAAAPPSWSGIAKPACSRTFLASTFADRSKPDGKTRSPLP